jgi:Ca2+-binding RTX toxin-like protein
MSGGAGDDVLFGRGGADHVDGRDGADLLSGGLGPDTLKGGDGNDTLIGCYGDDRFIGGRGFDTAVYLGRSADHLVTPDGDGHRVTFASGRYERLTGIERLLFSDGAFILDA